LFSQILDPKLINQQWKTDTSNRIVDLNEIIAVIHKDDIQAIHHPKFISNSVADSMFLNNEPVITVRINQKTKAYPLSILLHHEIVNDELAGQKICVTYCPLCNAAIVFYRDVEFKGKTYSLNFGVSGMLRNSDLVMYDMQTETWWQQFTGEGITGKLAGAELKMLSSLLISYEEFVNAYPDGLILSTETGFDKPYGTNPFENYDDFSNTKPRMFFGKIDNRFAATERVINIFGINRDKVYPLSVIKEKKVINDVYEGNPVVVFYKKGALSVVDKRNISESKDVGSVAVFTPVIEDKKLIFSYSEDGVFQDEETGSLWNLAGNCISGKLAGKTLEPILHGNHFAFAWFEFYPATDIYEEK